MKTEFLPRKGSSLNKEEAKKYGDYIKNTLMKATGELTPTEIVKDAEKKSSPLHDYFEWNDTEAGKKWRLQQARDLMANVVEIKIIDNREIECRSFFSINKGKATQCYVSIETALKTKSYREELIENIINHLTNTQNLLRILQRQ